MQGSSASFSLINISPLQTTEIYSLPCVVYGYMQLHYFLHKIQTWVKSCIKGYKNYMQPPGKLPKWPLCLQTSASI